MENIFRKTEEQLKELEKEVHKKQKEFWNKFKELEKKKIDVDEELLKEFLEEYWYINPKSIDEYEIIVPRWLNFSVGWLSRTTKGYNVFKVDKYSQWLGQMPDFLREELQIPEPMKIRFDGENVIFEEGKEEIVKDKFGNNLISISKGVGRVKKGKEFDLIAQIIENGSLPFIPKPVDKKDLRDLKSLNIKFEGKYGFQHNAWKEFLKYGAIGIYWMTGAGKDIFSIYALSKIRVGDLPNLYVSPNITILEQLKKEYFPKYCPELLREVENGKLVLSTYQGYDKIKNKEYGLIVFGECHVLPADTFSKLATIKTAYRLGQCLHPNTKITLETGNNIKLKELINKMKKNKKFKVLTLNLKNGRFESCNILRYYEKKSTELLRITIKTKNGEKIVQCTPEHKFYVNRKWIMAKNLKKGMTLKHLDNPQTSFLKFGQSVSAGLKEYYKKRYAPNKGNYGQKSYLKDKTFKDFFGEERANDIKRRISLSSRFSTDKHLNDVLQVMKQYKKEGYKVIPVMKVTPDFVALKDNKIVAVEVEIVRKHGKGLNYKKYSDFFKKFYNEIHWVIKDRLKTKLKKMKGKRK